MLLFCRKDHEPIRLGSAALPEIYAVTTEGVYEDVHAGGAVLCPWRCISTDDLLRLERYIGQHREDLE